MSGWAHGAFALVVFVAAAEVRAESRVGINLAGPADWMTELPFVDVFRTSRPWISQRERAGWGQGPALELDDWGWVKKLEPGCYAETMLCTIRDGHYPSGVYMVLYEGEGTLDAGQNCRVVEREAGRLRLAVDTARGGFSLRLRATNSDNYVRRIRVIMPGFEETWERDPFHPAFLKRWQGLTCYRFMDWMHTNGSEVRRWADRPTLDHATFSRRGVALEWMIELCNRQRIAPWFCMPHQADDDYVRRFARMVHERLNASLPAYIEYSNEVWNRQFAQAAYASGQGRQRGWGSKERPWEAGWQFTAARSMEIFRIWEEEFGGHERLVRVLPSQSGNTAVSEGILGFRDAAQHADALAVAPYMPYSIGRGKLDVSAEEMSGWTVDQMLDHFEKTALQNSLSRMARDREVANKYGLKLIGYEGGQHMVAFVKDPELLRRLTDTMHACNRHPRMGEIYTRYLDEWERLGGDVMAVFSSLGQYSQHGAWGLAEYYDSEPADYPKLDAVLRWARKRGQPVARPACEP